MSNRKSLTTTSFLALTDEEKEAIYQECEKVSPLVPGQPLTPAQRKLWRRAKRKLGRPVKGQGHKVIAVSLEKGLLKRADTFVKKTGMTRAALIARGLEAVLPAQRHSSAA